MTTSFINETIVDQELQLAELSELNGGWVVPAICMTGAFVAGLVTAEIWDEYKEDVADAIHDAISEEGDSGKNSGSYREEPGSRGGNRYGKPVLK